MKRKELTTAQLHSLLESAQLINSTLNLDELLTIIMKEITKNLDTERSTLYIVDKEKNEIWSKIAQGDIHLTIRQQIGEGISGYVARTGEVLNIADAYTDPRFNPEVDRKTGYRTRSVLCMPVRDKSGEIIAVVQTLNKKNGSFTLEDRIFLEAFCEYIAVAIQNARLYQEALERKKLESEMAVAGEIQRLLLPAAVPTLPGYEVFAFQEPSRKIGGDYYDFFLRDDQFLFLLADVSGKGIPAALLMANLQATARHHVEMGKSNVEIVSCINQHLHSITSTDKYATLFWATLDLKSHLIRYTNAGHIPPLLISPQRDPAEIKALEEGGIPVGFMSQFPYIQKEVGMQPDDILVICSDGITEAQNKRGQMFETERLKNIVIRHASKRAGQIGEKILQRVKTFSRNGSGEDDITLLIIKRLID
ncbi:MAG: hypothetical protein Kow0042_01970 [Calditrichia bacterium]